MGTKLGHFAFGVAQRTEINKINRPALLYVVLLALHLWRGRTWHRGAAGRLQLHTPGPGWETHGIPAHAAALYLYLSDFSLSSLRRNRGLAGGIHSPQMHHCMALG